MTADGGGSDWKARAEREAAAILAEVLPHNGWAGPPYQRLVDLVAIAWLQGCIYGTHATLADAEVGFEEIRTALHAGS